MPNFNLFILEFALNQGCLLLWIINFSLLVSILENRVSNFTVFTTEAYTKHFKRYYIYKEFNLHVYTGAQQLLFKTHYFT
ncbi:hypothetical protein DK880_00796 [Candidatus Cardinium hertigii]|uniref:Uncharacterized protein n=1 Tax=Candidatus Cardinium hertigii TaxID=247481 RepID=A0A2Z3LDA5_9BACT|nr:hypothetical protein DK880_00796 [Candidatus Cardinium hertigii]